MLFPITLVSALLFSIIYPLCFWISFRDPLKNNFHRFHIGLPCLVAGITAIMFWGSPLADSVTRQALLVWLIPFLIVCAISWNKESPNPVHLSMIFVLGLGALHPIVKLFSEPSPLAIFALLLGGTIFALALYCMNLGHWYLNVHGLPVIHLQRAVYLFWGVVLVKIVFNIVMLTTQSVMINGETYPLYAFLGSMEGFLLVIGILFGAVFPLVCLYFVKGTLDVKSTQSATGILYAILCAVAIGDITYKYFFFKYGIIL